ncbi:beta family protein [Amycolatopsis antarctica]|nr:beta family protein [Amycolatopsis antarctica]
MMPVPRSFHTLIALRAKQGEFAALNQLNTADDVRQVQPLLEFEANGMTPAKQLIEVEAVVRHLHRLGRHAMLDASDTVGKTGFGNGTAGAVGELVDRLSRQADLFDNDATVPFIPVIRSDATQSAASTTSRLCQELGAGGALRIRTIGATADQYEQLFRWLHVEPADLDLIVDLRYVDQAGARLTEDIAATLDTLSLFGPFRSRSLLCGSVPSSLKETAIWEAPRVEEQLWASVAQGGYADLHLGDYGVVHPLTGPGFRSKHVSVKYTCPYHWLYIRQRMAEPEDAVEKYEENVRAHTFRIVFREVVESDSFFGPDFSWGDREILDAAEGRGHGLGSTTKPVAFATSHHLSYLAKRTAA